ncbi:hypothetical protein [Pedobacter paludis]|uniref:hypothetical protein n=1 Tax=Pedobacter paludis TaxID=2203212 RepID=UPI0011B240F7|nr:hypothetical protein [Pedobacter paludis]
MKKYKKRIIFLCVFITVFVSLCFYWGYKIPQQDKHKDWPEFPNHTNKELVIKKDGKSISKFTPLPNSDLLLIYYKNPDSTYFTYAVMSKTGKIIHDFGYSNNGMLLDLVNNRLLVSHFVNNDTTTYEAYDAKTFKPLPVKYFKTGIAESFDNYLMGERGVEKPDYKGGTQKDIEYKTGENEELFKEKYRNKNIKFSKFLNGLTELYRFDEQSDGFENASYVKCTKDGSIYNFTYDDQESIEILCKGFFDNKYRKGDNLRYKNEHLSTTDSNVVVKNDFDANLRIYGGGDLFSFEFDQRYIEYYELKLKILKTNFKTDDRKSIGYNFTYGDELSSPKSDSDTLTFLSGGDLYLMFRRIKN